MFYYISKFLQQFVFPLNLTLLLLLIAWFLEHRNRKRAARVCFFAAFVWLYCVSTPFVAILLGTPLEGAFPSLPIADYPQADAIVVLGGTEGPTVPPRIEAEEIHGSRHLTAARLFKEKKAPLIVVAAGQPYTDAQGKERTRAADMRDILVGMGVESKSILLEEKSRNTVENAFYTAEVLKSHNAKKILLVTSAFHMSRAMRHFKNRSSLEVIPVPTDRHVLEANFVFEDFLPDEGSLNFSAKFIKEYFGYLGTLIKMM